MNAYASFDVLATAFHLRLSLGSLVREEGHLFGYLACLLFLYSGRPISEWGYSFAATPHGAPYSVELDDALTYHYEVGFLRKHGMLYSLTDRGEEEYRALSTVSDLGSRNAYLEAASSSSLAVPVGLVRRAISRDPDIHAARDLQTRRLLLDETALDALYAHFSALREAVGEAETDLLVPSVMWITYLCRESNYEESDTSGGASP
jgi:hypothetical protein